MTRVIHRIFLPGWLAPLIVCLACLTTLYAAVFKGVVDPMFRLATLCLWFVVGII
ncbi:hypothetical protein ACQ4M3_16450 [Leptolyngbya sp. AN03gr2]|uniref:hypothetical protein n=1 Tax=unclassified Leptolyngbya TaxID=2650499 RepID=UPI003D312D2E